VIPSPLGEHIHAHPPLLYHGNHFFESKQLVTLAEGRDHGVQFAQQLRELLALLGAWRAVGTIQQRMPPELIRHETTILEEHGQIPARHSHRLPPDTRHGIVWHLLTGPHRRIGRDRLGTIALLPIQRREPVEGGDDHLRTVRGRRDRTHRCFGHCIGSSPRGDNHHDGQPHGRGQAKQPVPQAGIHDLLQAIAWDGPVVRRVRLDNRSAHFVALGTLPSCKPPTTQAIPPIAHRPSQAGT
jgi:hypothetical protein